MAQATDYQLVAHGMSYHLKHQDNGKPYEWLNVGAGLRAEFNTNWAVQAGAYRNSFDRTSTYVIGEALYPMSDRMRVGANAGTVTGYPYNGGKPGPVASLVGRYEINESVELALRVLPPVHPKVVGTMAIEVAWRIK